tara:strand:- start:110 stop:367 length:258 start_codon:yes stop_codon:yes gene_type:complete
MFVIYDKVYIKKYMGNQLSADYKRIYTIIHISRSINDKHDKVYFEKYATLDNGREQLMYKYNILTKEKEFFLEHVPWYHYWWCGY